MLTGVGFQNEATQTGISYLSMAGGARIQVLGSMLGDMPNSNSVLFYPSATPGVSIPGTPLSCKVLSSFLNFFPPVYHFIYTKNLKLYLLFHFRG